jgi:hypothetical protein
MNYEGIDKVGLSDHTNPKLEHAIPFLLNYKLIYFFESQTI